MPGSLRKRMSLKGGKGLRNDFADDFAAVDGGAFGAAVVGVSQLEVVEAHQVEDSGVDVRDVRPAFGGAEADFLGGADDRAAPDAAPGHPHAEDPRVVVAAPALFV